MKTTYAKFKPLEHLLPEGFVAGDQILLSGTPGTGKTLMALQFIAEGAKLGEKGIYVSFESDADYLIEQASRVGIDVAGLINEGKMAILKLDPSDLYAALDEMRQAAKRMHAKRLCIDSISILSVYAASYRNLPEDLIEFLKQTSHQPPISIGDNIQKQMIYFLLKQVRDLHCTTLLISELPKNSEWYSRDTVSEFVSDGIILLDQQILGEENVVRTIAMVKMRSGDYKQGVFEYSIQKGKGIMVKVPH